MSSLVSRFFEFRWAKVLHGKFHCPCLKDGAIKRGDTTLPDQVVGRFHDNLGQVADEEMHHGPFAQCIGCESLYLDGSRMFMEDQIHECADFLSCVRTAIDIFHALGGGKEGFGILMELWGMLVSIGGQEKETFGGIRFVTTLSVILSAAAPSRMTGSESDLDTSGGTIDMDLQAQLLKLCTRDGTPEQARHAVYTMAAMLNPSKYTSAVAKKPEQLIGRNRMMPLALYSSLLCLRLGLALFNDDSGNKGGEKDIEFALETCLLGRRASMDDADSEASDEEMDDDEPKEPKECGYSQAND